MTAEINELGGGFSVEIGMLATLKQIPLRGRGVDNAAEVLALLVCILGYLSVAATFEGQAIWLAAFVTAAVCFFVSKAWISRIETAPSIELKQVRGELIVESLSGEELFSAPLDLVEVDFSGSTLKLRHGDNSAAFETQLYDAYRKRIVDRIDQAKADHGTRREVPQQLRAMESTR